MTHATLLLVDDDRHLLESMSGWLREQGYDVVEVAGYNEAIDKLAHRPFDLVVADIQLQDGDGFDILAHCREHHPAVTVMLITGYGTVETAIEALRAGAFDFHCPAQLAIS